MIVFETGLASIFDQLPSIELNGNTFKPRFNWGTQDVLNKFIALPENVSKYPLIWLVNGVDNQSTQNNKVTRNNTRLVIAKNSDAPNEFNDFQFQTDYDLVLNPLLENIIKSLERSGISKIIDYEYTVRRRPNYSDVTNENKTLPIWNAIVFEASIELKGDRCLKNIKFN